jgi:hypothetical protein
MKLLTTSMDSDYIRNISNYLVSHGIRTHIGNQNTSSLPGSRSYEQSIFILENEKYIEALSLLQKDGFFGNLITTVSKSNKSKNNKWFVFLASMFLAALLAFMALYNGT